MKIWGFLPENPTKDQPKILFVTAWQHWLGKVQICLQINSKPFELSCYEILKNSYFTDFITD